MSTNHRPQLESKRGKVIKIKDTIQHARGLPQQTSIKYRQDIKNEKTINKFDDLQKHDNNKITSLESISPPTKKLKIESTKEITTEPLNQEIDKQSKLSLKNDDQSDIQPNEKSESDEEDSKDEEDDESSDDDDSDDDDTALLLKEIENIRREKEKQNSDSTNNSINNSLTLQTHDSSTKKKSWRSSTTFNNKSKKESTNDRNNNYTTDTLNSQHHQKFMSKYIR
ncbi:Cwf15/Cwc15 cell cycle control family protein [Candida albicans]|uniref:Pre-mRNA-splicing factor CWC15 n=2 Tax=Candida albicans TaxID=5476 RepID=CWC15_CANAL|nr:U2-type spliceosomal complex subunit [Candida albicans SC5314]Q59PD3.1 RecName: Full=Pre-mRNA-splicing factor CWC15 [Candida albicans SC5314]KAF6069246.1 Cwf15/Cwc15 cell cycle control family protein [Candida albicans]KGR22890.1 pre-mRNA-splicing factor CWC15 [Candida albicans P37037]KGT71706.1 pre-mRNA-splicing factor CWC15 [Candida albicans 12C]KGU16825.1 pre-mRNA-splicing factor CWC15 [Candida albicans 19F]KHC60557.1 pre-mRNA-splicing factor CWC15 [Candida albicans P37039]|eukprot:XP_711578.1 U2-type spliceosomal complex subunit [Candida albicans SC5314]